jgi:endonuclease YncB( thermonuclease family)
MHFGILMVAALSAASVWFWPQLRVILAEQEWAREAIVAIDDATGAIPQVAAAPTADRIPEIRGKVVAISDGDSFTIQTEDKERIRIRLAEIDAPESGQAWGRSAKRALSRLIYAKAVRVETSGTAADGRTLGRVYVRNVDVNAEMVRRGSAHAYRDHLTDASLIVVEDEARSARRGLWSLRASQTTRPWEWRQERPRAAEATAELGCKPDRRISMGAGDSSEEMVALGASIPPEAAVVKTRVSFLR